MGQLVPQGTFGLAGERGEARVEFHEVFPREGPTGGAPQPGIPAHAHALGQPDGRRVPEQGHGAGGEQRVGGSGGGRHDARLTTVGGRGEREKLLADRELGAARFVEVAADPDLTNTETLTADTFTLQAMQELPDTVKRYAQGDKAAFGALKERAQQLAAGQASEAQVSDSLARKLGDGL